MTADVSTMVIRFVPEQPRAVGTTIAVQQRDRPRTLCEHILINQNEIQLLNSPPRL